MVEIHVLGPIEVIGANGPAKLGGPRQRRLIARLAADVNTVLSTDELIEALWEGVPPDGAGRSFKTYVARLRSALDDADPGAGGAIVTHSRGYGLELDRDRLDATRFEQMVQRARAELALGEVDSVVRLVDDARSMWRGQPFGEFAETEWAEAPAARLREVGVVAEEIGLEARLAAGQAGEVLPRIDELISRFPYRDGLRGLRATALYRMGRHVDALRALQDYRSLLGDEIGVDPGPELAELERQILDHDPVLQRRHPASTTLHDYELRERIGADDVAVVYRGVQPSVGRDVAVKVIRSELADDPAFIQRFEAEAQAMAGFVHPHVVPVYDYWREPGGAYLVMRWLGGGSLRDRIDRNGPLAPRDAVRVVTDVGTALMMADPRRGSSRAVRSSNIVFDDEGHPFVTTFGIEDRGQHELGPNDPWARPADGDGDRRARTSARADVDTLGAILFEALTGERASGPSQAWPANALTAHHELAEIAVKACAADPTDRFDDVAELLVSLRAAVGAPVRATVGDARSALLAEELARVNPYKGLRAFDEGDSLDFHGRDELVAELRQHVASSPLTCVVGPSGSGKSSVVRAGLVPELRRRGWFVATMTPGARPFEELRRALNSVATLADPTLAAQLMLPGVGVTRAAHGVLPPDGRLLIVIDQFEELFTLADLDRRDAFLQGLATLLGDDSSRVRVVFTLRADFYDRPLLHPVIGPIVRSNTVAVTPLDAQQLEAAITRPAGLRGVDFEPALVADLIADATANPGNLPLLQYTLTELYARRSGHTISSAGYAELGGISGTLAVHADELVDYLGPAGDTFARQLFTRLVTPGEGSEDTRRRVSVSELANVPPDVIDLFAGARLLTLDRDTVSREPTVEVAHEALIREWPRLRAWVDEDRESLRVHTHLDASARAWDERGRDGGDLYRGARLAAATEYRARQQDSIGPLATEFLDASVRVADAESRRLRRSRRRLRMLTAALGLVVVTALIAAWLAVERGNEADDRARDASVAALTVASENLLNADPSTATLLAVETALRGGEPLNRGALITTLGGDVRKLSTITPRGGEFESMVLSGDGTRLAVDDGTSVDVFDLATGELIASPADGGTVDLNLSADGSEVGVTYDEQGPMTILDVATGQTAAILPGPVWYSGRSPVGESLAIAGWQFHRLVVSLYPAPDSDQPVEFDGDFVLDFSGDGRFMALGHSDHGEARIVAVEDPLADPTIVPIPPTVDLPPNRGPGWTHLDERGERLIVHDGNVIEAFDVESGATLWSVTADQPIDWVQVGHHDRIAAVTAGTVRVHDLANGEPIGKPYVVGTADMDTGDADIFVDFTPDDVLVTGGQVVTTWSTGTVGGPLGSVLPGDYGVRFGPNGDVVATTSRLAELFVREVDDPTPVVDAAEIDRNGVGTTSTPILFSPDGARLVTIGGVGPATGPSGGDYFGSGRIRVLDAASGETLADERNPTAEPIAMAMSQDGALLAVGYRGGLVEVRSFPDIERVLGSFASLARAEADYDERTVRRLVFDADGTQLRVTNDNGTIRSFSWVSGQTVEDSAFPTGDYVERLADGSLAVASGAGDVRIYGADGEEVGPELAGHARPILDVAVAGTLIATVSQDGTVRLWDRDSHLPIGRPIPTDSPVVDLSPDGRWLATVEADGTWLRDLDPESLVEAACNVAGRNLTVQEWERYLPSNEPYRPTCPQWPDPRTD